MLFGVVMTPSLMPTAPDAWHMFNPSSVSVVIVVVILQTTLAVEIQFETYKRKLSNL